MTAVVFGLIYYLLSKMCQILERVQKLYTNPDGKRRRSQDDTPALKLYMIILGVNHA